MTIYENGRQLYIQWAFADGSKLRRKARRQGSRIVDTETSHGEFYKIDSSGNLEVHDAEGLIGVAKPAK